MHRPRRPRRKVPEITAWFWVLKLLTTAMGEAASDYLVHRIDPYLAVCLGGVALAGALALQLAARRYSAPVYWLAVAMVAVAGTMAADVLHVFLGVAYLDSTIAFAAVLTAVFLLWHRSEGTLSIHSIRTRRRELFYWATVMTTFALGTAAGDLTAFSLRLGFAASAVLFAVVIAIPGLAYRWAGLNEVAAFWFAYIITRPLGASVADWLDMPVSLGGLNLGRGNVSIAFSALIACLVAYMAASGRDTPAATAPPALRGVEGAPGTALRYRSR